MIATRDFLRRLCSPYCGGIKKVPREVRDEARGLLKHYPNGYDLGRPEAFDEATAAAEEYARNVKFFGKKT